MKKPAPRRKAPTSGRAADVFDKSAAPAIEPGLVEALAGIVARHDLSEVVVEHHGLHIRVARLVAAGAAPAVALAPIVAAPAAAVAASIPETAGKSSAQEDHPGVVKSPMVGTAYLRPSPDANPFVSVGATVKPGDKLLLVEAMKTFNEIVAPRAGTVSAILVEDGQPVEYGEPLLVIE
jgi:acetyl-CoA carboxylase biotin carboxyl carrier protein